MKSIKSPIVREKIYIMKLTEFEDGKCFMQRTCDGFTAYELLGAITLAQQEIIDQIQGRIRPDIIKREVIK